MPALPARKSNIRNVESGDIEARPRDAALRKSSNARASEFIRQVKTERSENQANSYPTVSQDFDQYSAGRTIQSTNTQFRTRTSTDQTRRVKTKKGPFSRGNTPQARLRSMDNSLETRGWLQKIENGLEEIDFDELEDFFDQYGDALNEKTRGIIGKALLARKYYKVSKLNIRIVMAGIGFWWGIQLPLAAFSLALFGVTYVMYDVIPAMVSSVLGETIAGSIGWITEKVSGAVASAVESVFGFNLLELLNPANYFMMTHLLVFVLGLGMLILMGLLYQISFVNCVFGKGSALKISMLLLAVFGYMVPLLNLIPWFLFWLLAVWRYPK